MLSDELDVRLVLMCADKEVLSINMSTGDIHISNETLLPLRLQYCLRPVKGYLEIKSKYEDTQNKIAIRDNAAAVTSWLANRTLLLSRANAKKIYQAYRLEQLTDEKSRAKLSIACRTLSVLDNYWVKLSTDTTTRWDDINIRHNLLNQAVAQIALHGTSLSLQGPLSSPEFTTNGAYAKAWHRDEDGSLWLYKLNDINSTAKIEVMVSNILDCMNITHCHYEAREDMGEYVCACPLMTNDDISIADGLTFNGYCNRLNIDPIDKLISLDADGFYKMLVVDYLIANPDRHGQNWGIYYDPKTTEILGLHPLFDHNNAFDNGVMDDENYLSHFYDGKSLKENAMMAIKKVDIHFTKPVTRDMFLTTKQYETFMKHAKQLGINTNVNLLLAAASKGAVRI